MENMMIQASIPWSGSPSQSGPYAELAAGIVFQAVKDYMGVIRALWKSTLTLEQKRRLVAERLELEEFFYSGWFEFLSDIEPDRLMRNCRMRALEKEKEAIRRQNEKRMKQLKKQQKEDMHNETGQDII